MNTNIELKKANGEIIKVELISYFEHILDNACNKYFNDIKSVIYILYFK